MISLNGIDYAHPESQREAALRECARVLKPGGTFIYSSHNLKSLHWFSPRYRYQLLWKFRNSLKAFKQRAYVVETGLHTLYTSREFVIRQTEQVGLELLEIECLKMIGNARIDRYFSPYLYYVFTKPARPACDGRWVGQQFAEGGEGIGQLRFEPCQRLKKTVPGLPMSFDP